MSQAFCTGRSAAIRQMVKRTAYATLMMLTFGTANAWAMENARGFRGEVPANVLRNCRPANGAEIRGGFAGSGDWVNAATGDICYSDHRPIAF